MGSPVALPILRNTTGTLNAQVLYGFDRIVSCNTFVQIKQNGTEQRWVGRSPLYNFRLPMSSLSESDRQHWLTAFSNSGMQGRIGQELEITLGTAVYGHLTLLSDSLEVTTKSPLTYDQTVNLRQVQPVYPYTVPTVGSSYPNFKWGTGTASTAGVEMPFTQVSTYLTSVNDNIYGPRIAYQWYGGGLANFPPSYLRSWKLIYPLLTDADMATLETFFLGQQGRYGTFTFKDPIDGLTYPNVRFDQDDLTIHYITKNQNSTEVNLLQVFGGTSGPSKPIDHVTINMWTEVVQVAIGATVPQNGLDWHTPSSGGALTPGATSGPYALFHTSSGPIFGVTDWNSLDLRVFFNSAIGASFDYRYNVYDAYLDVVYSDTTTALVRPTAWQVEYGTYPCSGWVMNGGNILGITTDPPATYATLVRQCSSPLSSSAGCIFHINGFVV